MRRALALVWAAVVSAAFLVAPAETPTPEPGFTGHLAQRGTCVRPDPSDPTKTINPYGNACARLKFTAGPIVVQPGDNDTGPWVKTIEKPWYDGYIVGVAPNLVRADGTVPAIEDIHLHHATWLSSPSYGNGPFFAAGEEKTIARFPVGYGMKVSVRDVWYAVFMIHNEGTSAETVWVTYDIDYIAAAEAEAPSIGMKRIRPFWLDVWKNGFRSSYPVFNVQRGYGEAITDPVTLGILTDPGSGLPTSTKECVWPRDVCAGHDSWSGVEVGQGMPGNGKGTDIYTEQRMAGTLIGIGGHLHPGGTRVEVDVVKCTEGTLGDIQRPDDTISSWGGLQCPDTNGDGVRAEESRRIFISDAVYFDHEPTSWNFSMTVTGLPRWKVKLEEGWFLRINAAYETQMANWYENMGIAVAYVAPPEPDALDPFAAVVDTRAAEACWADRASNPNLLCTRGVITHGPLPEANHPGGGGEHPWPAVVGPVTDTVAIAGFNYLPGDKGTAGLAGVPRVRLGSPLTFVNVDAASNVFHTVTACSYPCNGEPGIAYPIADFGFGPGAPGASGPVAFDSSELGLSPDFGPAKGQIRTDEPPPDPVAALTYTIVPAQLGLVSGETYTYFCRIHPFMQGAFTVVD